MASVSFVLKEPQAIEATLIYLLFFDNNKRLKYSTGYKIPPKFWNSEKQRAKETRNYPGYLEFNTYLNRLEHTTIDIHRRMINDGILPTPDKIRAALDLVLKRNSEAETPNSLISFAEILLATSIKKENTLKNYKQTIRILKEYKNSIKKDITFESVNLEFYDLFHTYCVSKNYSTNTIGGFFKNIKVFMNEAFDRGFTKNLDFKHRKFKTIEEESESIYLTREEIDTLYNLDLSGNTRQEKVRDMFVIGCYTGLRYSDLSQLNDQNLIDKGTKLKIKTEKTGETVVIPLHPYVIKIFEKYRGSLPDTISNQKMNEYLKELGELSGLTENKLIHQTRGGKKEADTFKKFELVTVHTARRSFATNAYLMDVPAISIMKITGHRTEKAFLKYIKISQEENANKLSNHPFFN